LTVTLSMVSLFVVRIPVLSEHRKVAPASSSMAVIWVTIALTSTHQSATTTASATSDASTTSAAFPSILAEACYHPQCKTIDI